MMLRKENDMLFNSYIFCLALLPIALFGWYQLKARNMQAALFWLLGASLIFYGYSSFRNLCLLCVSIIINYAFARLMTRNQKWKKLLLIVGLCMNLGILFFFKYLGFTVSIVQQIAALPVDTEMLAQIVLPLGISFYTFQQLSYLVDVYRGETEVYSLLEYSLFVSFFAQLIAGPIALHDEVIPQLRRKIRQIDWNWMADGMYAFSIGMAKKVLIADKLSGLVGVGYGDVATLSTTDAWIVMLAYTLQIYFDFSGYCDMAWGIGKLFHIELPINFYSPYRATSITEFWERWHITLTRFFRKYVYIPLGGNRKGKYRQYMNILIVFLLSGLWHGANWTFIFWGGVLRNFKCRFARPVANA